MGYSNGINLNPIQLKPCITIKRMCHSAFEIVFERTVGGIDIDGLFVRQCGYTTNMIRVLVSDEDAINITR